MSRPSKTRLWVNAITLASFYSVSRFSIPELLRAGKVFTLALFSMRKPSAAPALRLQRLRACQRCPVYDPARKTCGSPKSEHPDVGCWCYMPMKVGIQSAVCWAREQGLNDLGWSSNLMPDYVGDANRDANRDAAPETEA